VKDELLLPPQHLVEADLAQVVEGGGRRRTTVVVAVVKVSLDLGSQAQLQSSHSLFQKVSFAGLHACAHEIYDFCLTFQVSSTCFKC